MNWLKEKLGSAWFFISLLIRLFIGVLPFVMIDVGFGLTLLLCFVGTILPITAPIFWIWGLISAINGVQDIFAVIYYISFAVLFVPFVLNFVVGLFYKKR